MAASIDFRTAGYLYGIQSLNNSGLGFFGAGGFGQSVAVGAWQDTTYVTDGNGVSQGPQGNNTKWIHPASGQLAGSVNINLASLPNYQSTLNIHFTNDTPVRLQNSKVYIYDRISTSNLPSGVTTAVANIIHPNPTQGAGGSGSPTWEFPAGSSYINLSQFSNGVAFSPGQSGYGAQGGSTTDMTHDLYVAVSASPNSIGAKTYFGLLFSTEFL